MIEIRILVDDIDYKSTMEKMLPVVKERLERADESSPLKKSLSALVSALGAFGNGLLGIVSQKTKDKLAVKLVNSKEDLFKSAVSDISANKGISVTVKEIKAQYHE